MTSSIERLLAEKDLPRPSKAAITQLQSKVHTEQGLIKWFFEQYAMDQHPIASDKALDKSKETYGNTEWLAREVGQNFVDHNSVQGTLDGVVIHESITGDHATIVIQGPWAFSDPSALISPHSEKPDEGNSAGGNGFGIKQTALIYLRDKEVEQFTIAGDGWELDYNIADATIINTQLEQWGMTERLKHNWLCGELKNVKKNTKTNTYTIVTKDKQVHAALKKLPELTVNKKNPFLQNPSYESEQGAIIWHPQAKNKGRLFVNGQVMGYQQEEPSDHWGSLEGVSVRLNNFAYKMSLDRPPITRWDLSHYISHLTEEMDAQELITQLQQAKFLWEGSQETLSSEKGSTVLLSNMVNQLMWSREYNNKDFGKIFGDNLVASESLHEEEQRELREKGLTLCPEFFTSIGAPTARSRLINNNSILQNKPKPHSYNATKIAQESGIQVQHGATKETTFEEAIGNLRALGAHLVSDGTKYTIAMSTELSEKILAHPLPKPQKDSIEQQVLFALRSLTYKGLGDKKIQDIISYHGAIASTYLLKWDTVIREETLWQRNSPANPVKGTQIEFTSQENIEKIWKQARLQKQTKHVPQEKAPSEPKQYVPKKVPGQTPVESIEEETRTPVASEGKQKPYVPTSTTFGLPTSHAVTATLLAATAAGIYLLPDDVAINIPTINRTPVSITTTATTTPTLPTDVQQFFQWRDQEQTYGRPTAEQSPVTLTEIFYEYQQADIDENSRQEPAQEFQRVEVSEHNIENFAIVTNPTENERIQLQSLRLDFEEYTGYTIPNDIFLYTGNGTKGVNLAQEGIGLHYSLLDASYYEAFNTLTHEVSHNLYPNHGQDFTKTALALFARLAEKQQDMLEKMERGEILSLSESRLISSPNLWEHYQEE